MVESSYVFGSQKDRIILHLKDGEEGITESELQYLAGLVDADGCISMIQSGHVCLGIVSKHHDFIETLVEKVLHLNMEDVRVRLNKYGSYYLGINRQRFATPLVCALARYLVIKRHRAEDFARKHNIEISYPFSIEAPYIAGFFDGDGSVYWHHCDNHRYRYKWLVFYNTDKGLLETIQDYLSVGTISLYQKRGSKIVGLRGGYVRAKDGYQLRVTKTEQVNRIISTILLPYSRHPKKVPVLVEQR